MPGEIAHRVLPDNALHEPKHIQTAIDPADEGKVIVATGSGVSELRFLARTEIPEVDNALSDLETDVAALVPQVYTGVFTDSAVTTGTISVTAEQKQYYFVGVITTQQATIQLPDPTTVVGHPLTFKRMDAFHGDGSFVKVIPFDTETIDGVSELSITAQYTSATLVSDGTNWSII